jgi:sugar O-acyltransferase (sialic acid O-acetyltransferase NeuD family)
MTSLILLGAGGFGLELLTYAQDCIKAGTLSCTIKGFLDDTKPVGTQHGGAPVLGPTDTRLDKEALYMIAIGTPPGRKALANKVWAQGGKLATLIHPRAYAAATAHIGDGSILAPFSFAGPECVIGENVMLNLYASVAHESHVGQHSVLSPYAGTQARAKLADCVFCGAHTAITYGVTVGNGTKIAAGSVVYSDLAAGAEAFGNPARTRT